jgi:energy-coupling factor transport system permease protein
VRPPVLLYRRLASPLHATRAGVGALWCASLVAAAVLIDQPIVLLSLLVAVLVAGAASGVGRPLARSLRGAAYVAIPIVLVNVLVSRQGLTVFARVGDLGPFGRGDLTVEAVVYGLLIALRVTLTILATSLASLAVDPDEALRLLRRVSFRSAVTASVATRMLPVLSADAARLAEAQRTRPGRRPGQGLRARAALVRAVVAGSLERAVDVAATLELRGYAAAGRHASLSRPWSRHDVAFFASALAILALALLAGPGGLLPFATYPRIAAGIGPAVPAIAAALVLAVLLPFCDRRGVDP